MLYLLGEKITLNIVTYIKSMLNIGANVVGLNDDKIWVIKNN